MGALEWYRIRRIGIYGMPSPDVTSEMTWPSFTEPPTDGNLGSVGAGATIAPQLAFKGSVIGVDPEQLVLWHGGFN
jgi:hypothetical protein